MTKVCCNVCVTYADVAVAKVGLLVYVKLERGFFVGSLVGDFVGNADVGENVGPTVVGALVLGARVLGALVLGEEDKSRRRTALGERVGAEVEGAEVVGAEVVGEEVGSVLGPLVGNAVVGFLVGDFVYRLVGEVGGEEAVGLDVEYGLDSVTLVRVVSALEPTPQVSSSLTIITRSKVVDCVSFILTISLTEAETACSMTEPLYTPLKYINPTN